MPESNPNTHRAVPAGIASAETAPTFARLLDLLREHLRTGRSAFCDRCQSEIVFTPDPSSRSGARCGCGACNAQGL